ncbi:MAG: hypothetical protein JSR21_09915 [Proteobacteria bacterium]|nr:hypothetical protein [Pseudomonadota bacterium]
MIPAITGRVVGIAGLAPAAGPDIADVRRESLRRQIAMVENDTRLLHRSIRDNARYGRPDADNTVAADAARRPVAHDFIPGLEDRKGRAGATPISAKVASRHRAANGSAPLVSSRMVSLPFLTLPEPPCSKPPPSGKATC